MLRAELQDEIAGVGLAAMRHEGPLPVACFIADGTFDPKNDTAEVWIGSEMVQYDDAGDLIPKEKLPTFGPFPVINLPGQQKGLVGGERCYVIPVDGGGLIALASYDDAPAVNPGEWMQQHRAHPDSQFYLKNDGTAVHSAQKRAIVTGPRVCLGEDDSSGDDGVVRKSDLQKAIDDALHTAVQNAFNEFSRTVQPGSGAPPPTVAQVHVQSSEVTFSA